MARITRRDAVRVMAVTPVVVPFTGLSGTLHRAAGLSHQPAQPGGTFDGGAEATDRPFIAAYSTQEGQARKVAAFAAGLIRDAGHPVVVVDLERLGDALARTRVAAVLLAASVHFGRYHDEVHAFVERHRQRLSPGPTAFLSVCLSAATPTRADEAARYISELESSTGWTPDLAEPIAGALRYSRYGFLKRQMMKRIAADGGLPTDASQDHELTDWDQVRRVTTELIALTTAGKGGQEL